MKLRLARNGTERAAFLVSSTPTITLLPSSCKCYVYDRYFFSLSNGFGGRGGGAANSSLLPGQLYSYQSKMLSSLRFLCKYDYSCYWHPSSACPPNLDATPKIVFNVPATQPASDVHPQNSHSHVLHAGSGAGNEKKREKCARR